MPFALPDRLVERLDGVLTHEADVDPETRAAYEMVVALATALHRCGTASHDVEERMMEVTRALSVNAQFFATPTALLIQLGSGPLSETRLVRVDPASADLGRTARVSAVVRELLERRMDVGQALVELREIEQAGPPYGPGLTIFAFGLTALGAAVLFGGGLPALLLSAMVGALTGVLTILAPRLRSSVTRMFEPIASFLAATVTSVLCALVGAAQPEVVTLAALVVLLPGLSLTQAMSELAVRNLAAGTARLMGAATVLLTIAFGVAVGRGIAAPAVEWLATVNLDPLHATTAQLAAVELPGLVRWAACCATGIGLLLVLSGRGRDIPIVLVGIVCAGIGGELGRALLGPQLGPSLAALGLGLFANAMDRLEQRPPPVVLIPGLLLLVPGSLGLRAADLILIDAPVEAVGGVFATTGTAIALVAGLLMANAALPPVGTPSERHATTPMFRRLLGLLRSRLPATGTPTKHRK